MKHILIAAGFALAIGQAHGAPAYPDASPAVDTVRHRIDPVVVRSYRAPMLKRDVPQVVEVITPGDVARSTASSLSEMVKGFTPTESADLQGLTGGIELGGFPAGAIGTSTYTLLLRDGMRMGTANGATTFLTGIQSIELLNGPFSAIYGSGAMGGVVNMITPQSKGAIHGSGGATYGTWGTWGVGAQAGGSICPAVDFDLSLDYLKRTHDYRTGSRNVLKMTDEETAVLYADRAADTVYNNSTFDKGRALLRVGWDINRCWRLNMVNELYRTVDAAANGDLWGSNAATDNEITRNFHRLDLTGRMGHHDLSLSPFISLERSDMLNAELASAWGVTPESKTRRDYKTYGATLQDAMRLRFGTLVAGADNLTQRYSSSQHYMDATPFAPFQPDYMNSQTGLFAQLNFALWGKVTGVAGLRYDNIIFRTFSTAEITADPATRSYNTVNPTVSLQYRPVEPLRIHAGVGRAFLAPDAYKTAGVYTDGWGVTYTGNPDLKPEIAVTWQAGVGYAPADGALEADFSLFFTDRENMIYTESDYVSKGTYYNANEADLRGYTALVSFDLGKALQQRWSWVFRGTLTRIWHAEVVTPAVTAPYRYLSRTKANFGTTFALGRLTLDASARYMGGKIEDDWISYGIGRQVTYDADGMIHTPAFLVMDASASYRLCKGLTIAVKAGNLLDELYFERDGYYMPGRNFSVSLGVRF